jgi:hypothetical protein
MSQHNSISNIQGTADHCSRQLSLHQPPRNTPLGCLVTAPRSTAAAATTLSLELSQALGPNGSKFIVSHSELLPTQTAECCLWSLHRMIAAWCVREGAQLMGGIIPVSHQHKSMFLLLYFMVFVLHIETAWPSLGARVYTWDAFGLVTLLRKESVSVCLCACIR